MRIILIFGNRNPFRYRYIEIIFGLAASTLKPSSETTEEEENKTKIANQIFFTANEKENERREERSNVDERERNWAKGEIIRFNGSAMSINKFKHASFIACRQKE